MLQKGLPKPIIQVNIGILHNSLSRLAGFLQQLMHQTTIKMDLDLIWLHMTLWRFLLNVFVAKIFMQKRFHVATPYFERGLNTKRFKLFCSFIQTISRATITLVCSTVRIINNKAKTQTIKLKRKQ